MKVYIYSYSTDEKKAEGYPVFSGGYMKSGVLTFREICSPTPIEWEIGDYLVFDANWSGSVLYPRTALPYKLYDIPQAKRQARNSTYGAAWVYQDVKFYDVVHQLSFCPFRDLVVGDNRVHFSTQPMISVYDDVYGIRDRIQACVDNMYGSGAWYIEVSSASGAPTSLMADEREFVVSGKNILETLDYVYELWPEVGWRYERRYISTGVYHNVISIGNPGVKDSTYTFSYGKAKGMKSLTRTLAEQGEIANRIYAYGSSRNMLSRWYSQFTIKDAESVDIQHLMLPMNGWGTTDYLPDPAKAYVEDSDSISAYGLRPKTVYFDGSGDYKEIYPTLSEITISVVRSALDQSARYYPSNVWGVNDRVDQIFYVADGEFPDDGFAAPFGQDAVQSEYAEIAYTTEDEIAAGTLAHVATLAEITDTSPGTGNYKITASLNMGGYIEGWTFKAVYILLGIYASDGANYSKVAETVVPFNDREISAFQTNWYPESGTCTFELPLTQGQGIKVTADLYVDNTEVGADDASINPLLEGQLSFRASAYRGKTFKVTIPQVGFDIEAAAALGNGKTLAMKDGACAGRTFAIKQAFYDSVNDAWVLEVFRSEDESLAQWFPNSSYKIEEGDTFVLLDIAMPDAYVSIAEYRLYVAAEELLADLCKENWQYVPEFDAKETLIKPVLPGRWIRIRDLDFPLDETVVVSGQTTHQAWVMVDTVTINEGESELPIYKATLRNRKKRKYSDKASVPETSFKSVGGLSETSSGGGGASATELLALTRRVDALDSLIEEEQGTHAAYVKPYYTMSEDDPPQPIANPRILKNMSGLVFATNTGAPATAASGIALEVVSITTGSGAGAVTKQYLHTPLPFYTDDSSSAGGIGTGGGGGGGVSYLRSLQDVTITSQQVGQVLAAALDANNNPIWVNKTLGISDIFTGITGSPSNGQTVVWNNTTGKWEYGNAGGSGTLTGITMNSSPVSVSSGVADLGTVVTGVMMNSESVTVTNGVADLDVVVTGLTLNGSPVTVTNGVADLVNVLTQIPSAGSTSLPIWVDSNHQLQTITAVGLGSSGYFSFGQTTTSGGNVESKVTWDADVRAWKLEGNFYATGWVASGGISTSGGGGGGGVSYLRLLSDVRINNQQAGQVLSASFDINDNPIWVNKTLSLSDISDATTTLNSYVTLNTAQTITGQKTFSSMIIASGGIKLSASGAISVPDGGNTRDAIYITKDYLMSGYASSLGTSSNPWSVAHLGGTTFYGNVRPDDTDTYKLGTSAKRWSEFYSYKGNFAADVIPATDASTSAVNLGDADHHWDKVFARGLYPTTGTGTPRLVYDSNIGGFMVYGNLVATGYISAGGISTEDNTLTITGGQYISQISTALAKSSGQYTSNVSIPGLADAVSAIATGKEYYFKCGYYTLSIGGCYSGTGGYDVYMGRYWFHQSNADVWIITCL